MGAWGFSITENDAALDAYDEYIDLLNANLTPAAIDAQMRKSFAEQLADEDDAVEVELGMAKAKWDCGHVTPATVKRIKQIIDSNAGMALWEEAGENAAAKRRKVLDTFLKKLQTPNPRPKKPRKPSTREPIFKPGDCLSIYHSASGKYAAAIVLLNPIEKPKPGQDKYGVNSIGFLDYFEKAPPTMAVFEARQWMYVKTSLVRCPNDWMIATAHETALLWKTAHNKKVVANFGKPQITVVGRVQLSREDALEKSFSFPWTITDHFLRAHAAYTAAKSDRTMKRHRTYNEMLDCYPKFRDELRKLGSRPVKNEFDYSAVG